MAHTFAPGTSTATDNTIAPDPVPRSTTTGDCTSSRRSSSPRDLDHLFRLRSGDQHATIDVEVEAAEPPLTDGVLQGLTRLAAGGHARALDAGPLGRPLVEMHDQLGTVVARGPLDDAAGVDAVSEPRLHLGQQLSPRR